MAKNPSGHGGWDTDLIKTMQTDGRQFSERGNAAPKADTLPTPEAGCGGGCGCGGTCKRSRNIKIAVVVALLLAVLFHAYKSK